MTEPISLILPTLIQLSELDSTLARLLARRRQLEEQRDEALSKVRKLKADAAERELEIQRRRAKYEEEETRIREESSKLVERRKALATFSNYKVQQSAQKEIELSAKQLSLQEEKLLSGLEEIESLESERNELTQKLETAEVAAKEALESLSGEIDALIERAREKEVLRRELASSLDSANLQTYESIRKRHPIDPLAAVQNGRCGGCSMQVAPQMMVQISRAAALVKCRGCSRVLFLPSGDESSGAEAS